MTNVISMFDKQQVKPKSEARRHRGHCYQLLYMPQMEPAERWGYKVAYTRVYHFAGNCATIEKADKAARSEIDKMEIRNERATR